MSEERLTNFQCEEFESLVERIEEAETRRAEAADDVKALYGNAKLQGFSVKAMRQVVKERRTHSTQANEEYEALLEQYRSILGLSSI